MADFLNVLIPLAIIGAVGYFVVWPKVKHRVLGNGSGNDNNQDGPPSDHDQI